MTRSVRGKSSQARTGGTATRILVTGAAGNVGSKLCQALLGSGYSVVGVDNFFSGLMDNIVPLLSRRDFIFHEASITEPDFLPLLWRRYGPFEAVLHMAAVVSVPWSMEHAEQTLAVNYQATVNLHSAAQSLGVKAFVIAGH